MVCKSVQLLLFFSHKQGSIRSIGTFVAGTLGLQSRSILSSTTVGYSRPEQETRKKRADRAAPVGIAMEEEEERPHARTLGMHREDSAATSAALISSPPRNILRFSPFPPPVAVQAGRGHTWRPRHRARQTHARGIEPTTLLRAMMGSMIYGHVVRARERRGATSPALGCPAAATTRRKSAARGRQAEAG